MSKKKKLIMLIIVLTATLGGCFTKDDSEIYADVKKHLVQMEGYQCTSEIKTYDSTGVATYTAAQWFKSPNKYRIEIIDGIDSQRMIIVYNGSEGWIHNPGLGSTSMFEKFYESGDRAMFLGSFTGHFLETEDITYGMEEIDGIKCVVMELRVPSGNIYVHRQKIWITKNKFEPYRMEIYNIDRKKVIDIKYRDFKENQGIENSIFELEAITTIKYNR